MKKLLIPAVILSLAIAFSSCNNDGTTHATGVNLTPGTASLAFGETLQLTATVFPTDAVDRTVTWGSSDDEIATVDDEGLVTAVTDDGTATITVTTVDGGFQAHSIISISSSILANRCNTNMPNWGPTLGTVGFATDETWEIRDEDGVLVQTWSDAVTASNCSNREAFNGGADDEHGFNADCRNNPDFGGNSFAGDAFSWCAVVRFANQLCPYPWRVPTPEDFELLAETLGSLSNFVSLWGGAFAGAWEYLSAHGMLTNGTRNGMGTYWTAVEVERAPGGNVVMMGGALELSSWFNSVTANSALSKNSGTTLRCVR